MSFGGVGRGLRAALVKNVSGRGGITGETSASLTFGYVRLRPRLLGVRGLCCEGERFGVLDEGVRDICPLAEDLVPFEANGSSGIGGKGLVWPDEGRLGYV